MTFTALPLAVPVVSIVLALSIAAYLYWDREPVKAQRFAVRVFSFCRRVFGWAAMMVVIPGLLVLSIVPAMLFVTLRAIQCKPAKVHVKLT